MRIAVYGGSFDPPHVAHALVASWLVWTDRCDEVWFVPSAQHPFGKRSAPFEFRLALCQALSDTLGPQVRTDAIEADLDAPSYTIDTLRALRDRHAEHTFCLVLGADNLDQLDDWKDWDAIEARFDPIVVGRQGYPVPDGAIAFPGVSSTDVRRRLRAGEPVGHLVPAAVLRLIGDRYR